MLTKIKVTGINPGVSGTGTGPGTRRLYDQALKYKYDLVLKFHEPRNVCQPSKKTRFQLSDYGLGHCLC
jgi:hypothetical protein